MLKKMKTNEGIQYKKLSPEEMKARGILGRLIGPCADFNNATRNGRKYSEQLWENVFNDPIMQEKIKNGVCFGELGHPEDRTEIDMEKIAVCLREQPVKNEKGQLCAVFDILDTPNGRILKTLCDYGSTVGVSSRGQGDIITDIHGEEAVDPDTYECECWDVVLVPAVESARMTYVKEGLEDKKTSRLKKALTESLKKATEEDRKVMEKTLEDLNIKLDEDINITNTNSPGRQEAPRTTNNPAPEEQPTPTTEITKTDEGLGLFGIGDVNVNLDASGQNNAVGLGASQPKNEDLDEEDDYEELANQFINDVKTMTLDEAKDWFFNEYNFNEHGPEDEVEQKIFDALKNRIEELGGKIDEGILSGVAGLANGLSSGVKDIPVLGPILASDEAEKADQEEVEQPTEDEIVVDDIITDETPVDEIPPADSLIDDTTSVEEEEPVEEDTRTDEEIFLDYLKNNFDEKQIKKACKALDIEVPEDEEESEEEPEEESEEETSEEDEKPTEVQAEEEPEEKEEESNDENRGDKEEEANEVVEESVSAINDGDAELLKSLQEALKGKSDLEGSVKSLQEKLAVSDTKVNELTEECNNYKKAIARLATMSKSNKDLKESVTKLEESLKEKDATILEQKTRIARLVKSRKESVTESASLNESVQAKTTEVSTLTESLNKANEDVKTLNEQLSVLRKDSEKNISELNENLNKAKTLKEAYKKLANKAVNKYIDIKATTLGLTSTDIKRKLGESYTLEDVDQVCEDLKAYQLNVSKLPFSIDRKVGVRVNESLPKVNKKNDMFDDDDEVSDNLIRLAKGSGVKF